MKCIELNKGQIAIVDDADFERLAQYRWRVGKDGHVRRNSWPDGRCGKQKVVWMAHEVLRPPNGRQVDHRNLNPLDNRRENLRAATHGQNMQNKPTQVNNTSGYKGVSFRKRTNKYRASIGVGGRRIHLGEFETKEAAAEAYKEAAKLHHGDFHRLN